MWAAMVALLHAIPVIGGIIDKLVPTRKERETDSIRRQKQRERQEVDDWVDRGGPPSLRQRVRDHHPERPCIAGWERPSLDRKLP